MYRIWYYYNARLPSFHKQHIEASHRLVVDTCKQTNRISPPCFSVEHNVVRNYFFFRLTAQVYIFFRYACIFYIEKNNYSILHTISNIWQFYISMSYTTLIFFYPVLIDKKKSSNLKKNVFFKTFKRC